MRFAACVSVAILSLSTSVGSAQLRVEPRAEPSAEQVIQEAIDLLTTRHLELTHQADRDKVYDAVEQLRKLNRIKETARVVVRRPASDSTAESDSTADAPPDLKLRTSDFIDHTERYRGHVVTLPLTVRSRALVAPGRTLRELQGRAAQFQGTSEEGNTLDILINLPEPIEIPKVAFGDRVVVTFRCREGDLQRGNVAIAIRRPETQ